MSDELLPAFRFLVTLDAADAYLPAAQAELVPKVAIGAFQEVRGLGADLEVTAYPEGGLNHFVHQLPVRHTWTRISLKGGVMRDVGLWTWYVAGLHDSLGARRDGCVILQGLDGRPAVSWQFHAGLAVKWQGPEFNAMQGTVAIESLEIVHHGLELVPVESAPDD